jgi:DNA-binding LacI/PurR family transcriptional regulator
MKRKINTMAELSEMLGMSRATLSRYFQDPSSVRRTTKSKIEAALREVDYVPNFFARNMNRQKTKLVGVVIPYLSDLFYTNLIEAIERRAKHMDYGVIIQVSNNNRKDEIQALESLRSMNAGGVIIAPLGAESDIPAFERINRELPLVFVDSTLDHETLNVPFVGTDNRQSIQLMVNYLCRTGKPPVFFNMPNSNSNSVARVAVYRDRMCDLGHEAEIIEPNEDTTRWDFEEYAYARMSLEFGRGSHLDSTILCANDRLAMGVLRAANEFGLFSKGSGGEQPFRVAGHDDHPLSGFLWPSLTTVSQDSDQLGQIAFEMLVERAESPESADKPIPVRLLQSLLVLRDSA